MSTNLNNGGIMKSKIKILSVALGLMLLVLPFVLSAQITTSTLRGHVTDDQGDALPGVTIEITSKNMMTPRSTVTDDRGNYRFLYIPPGTYTVCAKLEGFEMCWVRGVPVQVAQTATANAVLKMGGLEETINVTAEAPVIDTESSSKSYNVNLEMLTTVPIKARLNFRDVFYTLPGVIGHGEPYVNAAVTFENVTFGGEQHWQDDAHENKIMVDGMEINDAMSGATYGFINHESIQEMDIKTAGAPAEYGNSRTGFMNIITKSGGNTFQGSALFEWQPESFNTTNVEGASANKISYAVPALTLSGPILKDKLWFLASYKYDNEDYVYPNTEVEDEIVRKTRSHLPYLKLTFQLSPNHTISAVYSRDHIRYDNRGFPSTRYSTLSTAQYRVDGGTTTNLTWRWIINDSTYFNFVGGYNYAPRSSFAENQIPRLRYTERNQGGSTLRYDGGYGEDYWSVRDNVLLTGHLTNYIDDLWGTGSHEIKLGLDIRPFQHATRTRKYHEDEFGIYRYRLGLDNANYGLSAPYIYRGYAARGAPGTPQDRYDNEVTVSNQNFYIQDSWLASKNLTFHIGFRWEHQQEYMHYREELPADLSAIYSRMSENVEFNDSGIAPRLGLTYNWEGVGVFKLHFGRYFEYVGTGDYNNYARVVTFDEYRIPTDQIGAGAEALTLYKLGALSFNPNYNKIDGLAMEYNDEFIVSFERELFGNLALEATFINRYSQISWEEDVNAVFENGQFVDRIFPEYDIIWMRNTYKGDNRHRNDYYKGLQFQLKRNFTGSWGMMASYSFMWRDHKRTKYDPGDPLQYVYSSPSDQDRIGYGTTWTFHFTAFYRLPWDIMVSTFINGDSGEWFNAMDGDYAWDADPPLVTLSNGRKVDDITFLANNYYFAGKKYGEVGRYTDALWTINFRLSKGFNISNVRVEAYVDFYNILNSDAYRSYNSNDIRRTDRYNTKTSPQTPRTAQVSLRITF
jgi:hypothetical protein